uniref:Uncharacterized protein n=1 Tax=Amphimedon queenslandica TaxID=400682 RepID=A0A1X7TF93_AMPQE
MAAKPDDVVIPIELEDLFLGGLGDPNSRPSLHALSEFLGDLGGPDGQPSLHAFSEFLEGLSGTMMSDMSVFIMNN